MSITLPSIRRTIVLVAVIEIILQFQLFGQALLITGGGPNNTSRPIVQFIYESRLPRPAARLCRRGVAGAVRAHAAGRAWADVDRPPAGGPLSMAVIRSRWNVGG